MSNRSDERSPYQYSVLDTRTKASLTPWSRLWKTKLFAEKFELLQAARKWPTLVILVREPPDYSLAASGVAHLPDEIEIGPGALKDLASPYYWDVSFPRRSGRRGLPPAAVIGGRNIPYLR